MAETAAKIDLDRGVEMRRHQTGIEVYMYVNEPGRYLSAHGAELPEAVAKGAGFPVEELRKAREKAELLKTAHDEIDAQFKADSGLAEVVAERDNWKVVHTGAGRHDVFDDDGNKLNPTPLTGDIAMTLFNQLAPPKSKVEKGDLEDAGKETPETVKAQKPMTVKKQPAA